MNKLAHLKQALSNKNQLKYIFESMVKNKKLLKSYDLIIATTAITRIILHKKSFTNYKEFVIKPLIKLNENIKILWIINIDFVKEWNMSSLEEDKTTVLENTREEIINIFGDIDNVSFEFNLEKDGNFNKAVRKVSDLVGNYLNHETQWVLYLEDDWSFNKKINDYFTNINFKGFDAINFFYNPNKKISFQPCLIKTYVWYMMFPKKLEDNLKTNIDPERICTIGEKELINYDLRLKTLNYCHDIGRDYALENNLFRGWSQSKNIIVNFNYINFETYLKSILIFLSKTKKYKNHDELIIDLESTFKELYWGIEFKKYFDDHMNINKEKYLSWLKDSNLISRIKNIDGLDITTNSGLEGISEIYNKFEIINLFLK